VTIVEIGSHELPARSAWTCPLWQLPMRKNMECRAVADHEAQLSSQIVGVGGCGIGARIALSQGRSFNPQFAMISERCTGTQTECRSGLSSLERAQGLRDLRATEWAPLGDHGGGGMVFRGGKRRALSVFEKDGQTDCEG
jgi:hypothetical protein